MGLRDVQRSPGRIPFTFSFHLSRTKYSCHCPYANYQPAGDEIKWNRNVAAADDCTRLVAPKSQFIVVQYSFIISSPDASRSSIVPEGIFQLVRRNRLK